MPILKLRVPREQMDQGEPDEVLVIDARCSLTPVQQVEQKLLALLGGAYPGLSLRGTSRRGNLLTLPGK
jgi:hypothetical protein